jgi:hypothetical protein
MNVLLIVGCVIYGLISVLVTLFSGLIWGTTKSWGKFEIPNYLQFFMMFLSGVFWPIFLIWAKIHGPFNTGIFT